MKFLSLILAAVMLVATADADAKRIGGGKPLGRQSSNVTQRDAAPAAPAAPAQNATNAAAAKPAGAAPGAAAPKRPWGAMLGGLAAGLGLAWLASSLGFGEAFGQFMLFALLALVIMVVIGMVMRARRGPAPVATGPYALQGAGSAADATALRQYSPDKVGNDASARPWERNSMAFDAGTYTGATSDGGVQIGSALAGTQSWGIPAGFDAEGFLAAAKRNFVTLQDAWDQSDMATLRSMMTAASS